MGEKELNIKNQTYYFLDDMIDIKKIHSNLLKIHKKYCKELYLAIKKFSDCKNIHSVNPLYLIIRSATGYFKEEYDEKYLILDSAEKYEKVFSGIKSEIEMINGEKKCFMKKIMQELMLIQTMIYL